MSKATSATNSGTSRPPRISWRTRGLVTAAWTLSCIALLAAAFASVWFHPLGAPFCYIAPNQRVEIIPRVIAGAIVVAAVWGLQSLVKNHPKTLKTIYAVIITIGIPIGILAFLWETMIGGSIADRSPSECAQAWPRAGIGLFWSMPMLALVIDAILGIRHIHKDRPPALHGIPIASCIPPLAFTAFFIAMQFIPAPPYLYP